MMKTDNRRIGAGLPPWLCIATIVALGVLGGSSALAEARVHPRDNAWIHPQIERLMPAEVAVLPAVAYADNPEAIRLVEVYGSLLLAETGHIGQPASRARRMMAGEGRRPDLLYEAMARQVRTAGVINASMAAKLSRLTGAPALMSLRIDRWEIVDGRAQVELTAAVVDSRGQLLWRISGLAGHGGSEPSRLVGPDLPATAFRDGDSGHERGQGRYAEALARSNRLDPARTGDPERALMGLMNRWIPSVPVFGDPDQPGVAARAGGIKTQASEH